MTFDDLKFRDDAGGLPYKRALIDYGKFHLSIIQKNGTKWYDAAILDAQNEKFINLPNVNDVNDVIPFLKPNQITALLNKLSTISGSKPKQVKKIK